MTSDEVQEIQTGEGWSELAAALEEAPSPSGVYVVGADDTGKSALCRYLVRRGARLRVAALVDCDPGQQSVGPPTTAGLKLLPGRGPDVLRFIGSTTPLGHLLPMVTAAKRLAERAREGGASTIVFDTPGLVGSDVAREFHFQMVDLLQPDHLVGIARDLELEPLLAAFRRRGRIRLHRMQPSPAIRARSQDRRRLYREERFRMYFHGAVQQELPLDQVALHGRYSDQDDPSEVRLRLVAPLDAEGFVVVLGVLLELSPGRDRFVVLAPPFDPERVVSIQFGSIELDPVTIGIR